MALLKALGLVGNQGNCLLVAWLHLLAKSSYFLFICIFQESYDPCLFIMVNVFFGLPSHLVIL